LRDRSNIAAEQLAVSMVDENGSRAEADDGVAVRRDALIEAREPRNDQPFAVNALRGS
jgi:hypothetical protein